tara:strand:+ start:1717 stop:3093 length:1377 start_codon:yes stop_codon:yes gene_type:complete
MAENSIQIAGEFRLETCKVLTTSGLTLDIRDITRSISVFENIYSECISGTITVADTTDVVNNGPIIGEEKLLLKLVTPQTNRTTDTTIDYTKTPLLLYKIGTQTGDGEKANIITFHFTSQEAYYNSTSLISKSYNGKCSEILKKILRDERYLRSSKKLRVEETSGSKKIVFPNLKPFQAIKLLSRQSKSKNFGGSPSYLFYETTKGYHYRSVDGLCSQKSVLSYAETTPDSINDRSGQKDILLNLQSISSYTVNTPRDIVGNTYNGMYSSKHTIHDLYNKSVSTRTYNYHKDFDKDTHLNAQPLASQSIDQITTKGISDYSNTINFVTITSSGKAFDENSNYTFGSDNLGQIISRRHSRLRQLQNGISLNIEVPGNTFIQAGDTIDITIGASSTVTDRKNDPNLSGKFLITNIRHDFVEDKETKHTMLMTVIKDSTINQYPNGTVSYENKTKPEEITL